MKHILVTIPTEQRHRDLLESKVANGIFTYCAASDVTDEQLAQSEIIIGNLPPERMKKATSLQFLQLNSAGADNFTKAGVLPEGVKLTNATGGYGLAISEHMLASLLMLMKKLDRYYENKQHCLWQDEGSVRSVYGSTVVILGFGDIGQEFAKRVKALGSYVIGVRRHKGTKPEFVDEVVTTEELDDVLPRADVLAMSLPNTPQTYHILNAERFAKMKKGSYLLNVGRGTSVDQDALLAALQDGTLAGAAVDVTDPEPLPSDHPLWKAENLILTPHCSGAYHLQETLERIIRISAENLEHFEKKEPLRNEVDFATGYRKFPV